MKTDSIASRQVGGSHYQERAIQPIDYIIANELNFCEGSVVKYITRWKYKNGLEDLEKAKHYIEFLIEAETRRLKESAKVGDLPGAISFTT